MSNGATANGSDSDSHAEDTLQRDLHSGAGEDNAEQLVTQPPRTSFPIKIFHVCTQVRLVLSWLCTGPGIEVGKLSCQYIGPPRPNRGLMVNLQFTESHALNDLPADDS